MDVFPSPKSHAQDEGMFVEASVNCTANVPAHPCVAVKSATGVPGIVTTCDAGGTLAPQPFDAVSVTVYVPVEASVNCTATVPAHPCVAVKSATDATPVIVTACDAGGTPMPQPFDAVSVTV